MGGLPYAIYDVFTDTVFAGNPLAVVWEGDSLDTERMQAVAKEFNLSETVFICEPDDARHSAQLRIFTPKRELPFAGHPTVGAVIAMAEREQTKGSRILMVEEKVGSVRCVVEMGDGPGYGEFDVPVKPERADVEVSIDALAAALGLTHNDMMFENHQPTAWKAGNAFTFVPVSGLGAMERIVVDDALLKNALPTLGDEPTEAFVYCRDTVKPDASFHARMFAPHMGIPEDPATGSAVAAFAGAIGHFDGFANGPNAYWVEQGVEMGRPSLIRLEVTAHGDELQASRIGGHAVKVMDGTLFA